MNQELKKKWTDALLSGKFEQGAGQLLHTGGLTVKPSYCCLGVLREIADPTDTDSDGNNGGSLSTQQLERFGITSEEESGLIELNDLNNVDTDENDPEAEIIQCGSVPFEMIAGFIDYWL